MSRSRRYPASVLVPWLVACGWAVGDGDPEFVAQAGSVPGIAGGEPQARVGAAQEPIASSVPDRVPAPDPVPLRDPDPSDGLQDARRFVARVHQLANSFDPTLVELYADDADLVSRRVLADGTSRPRRARGAEIKRVMPAALQLARRADDRSEYHNLRFRRVDDTHVEVRGRRVSLRKCYTDDEYALVLREVLPGEFEIVEERGVSRALSACPDEDPAPRIAAIVAGLGSRLPVALHDQVRLDAVSAPDDGRVLLFSLTLVDVPSESTEVEALFERVHRGFLGDTCLPPDMRRLLDGGASVIYRVSDPAGELRRTFVITEHECG